LDGISQNIDLSHKSQNYFSNRLYVVYDYEADVFWGKDFELTPSIFPEFEPLIEEFGLTRVQNSFYFSDNAFLERTITLFFTEAHRCEELIAILSRESRIQLVERKPLMKKSVIPNDPSYGVFQSELPHIGAEEAWDITTGSGSIDVAVVDDAIQVLHPDLNTSFDGNWDVANNDSSPSPPDATYDHGTHVAGIVSAKANNNQGVASIGFGGVDIIAIKAADGTTNPEGDVLITHAYEGVVWAANNGAEVINCSWGSDAYSVVGQNAINDAWNQGCIIVASAGNDDDSIMNYPAAYENVIAVASTNLDDAKSSFSSYGSWVDISAPGSYIYNTVVLNNYGYKSGTSMSSPLVAGLIGLIWSVDLSRTREEVIGCLLGTAKPLNWSGGGSGRIDAHAAVVCALSNNTWVDYTWSGLEYGTFENPFDSLIEAVEEVEDGGIIFIRSSTSNETININVNKSFTIRSWNGPSIIGQ
jgi:subtilisin family serine protease